MKLQTLPTLNNQPSTSRLCFADNPNPTESALVPVTQAQQPCEPDDSAAGPAICALQFSALAGQTTTAAPKKPRNGKIAHLPKPEREMVNLMLKDNVGYYFIEQALQKRGFNVSERNISNWKTCGGYNEWRAAQAQALELRNFQDNLTDFLRRHDAAELPEVGLQSAATNLSAILLRPDLMPQLLADPDKYSKLIELQCRLAREIHTLQKDRDEVSKLVGGTPERHKRHNQEAVENVRKLYSSTYKEKTDHFVPPRNFIPKQLDPVHKFTYPEKEAAQKFEALFKPKSKAIPAPPASPKPNAEQAATAAPRP